MQFSRLQFFGNLRSMACQTCELIFGSSRDIDSFYTSDFNQIDEFLASKDLFFDSVLCLLFARERDLALKYSKLNSTNIGLQKIRNNLLHKPNALHDCESFYLHISLNRTILKALNQCYQKTTRSGLTLSMFSCVYPNQWILLEQQQYER